MPSFDVVSEVDMMEVKNAIEQAQKELANRFDFREAKAEIILEKESIKLSAINQFKIQALEEIVLGKLARRNVSLKNVERKDADISPAGPRASGTEIETGPRDRYCQDHHHGHPRHEDQGPDADSGPANSCYRQKPRRFAGGHCFSARQGVFPSRSTTPIFAREALAG